jgi:hypothetical protein
MKTYTTTLYSCGCGYETLASGNACRHKKSSCGHTMTSITEEFVLKRDASSVASVVNTSNGDHNINYFDQKQITINLVVPNADTRTLIYKACETTQFQRDLAGEFEVEKIPALIFRHAKGRAVTHDSPNTFVKLHDDKVHEKDVNGNVTQTSLNKYARKFIGDAMTSLTTHTDVIKNKQAKELVDDMYTKNLSSHKRGEKISTAEVLQNFSSGDHVVYKYPAETRKVVDTSMNHLKNVIREASAVV